MVLSVPLAETVLVELPGVRLRTIEAMSGFIRAWLEDQTIDLGFLYEVADLKNCDVRHLMDEDLHFYSAPDNWPLSSPPGTAVSLADIQRLDLVLPSPYHGLRQTIDRYVRAAGKSLNVVIEMDALSQIKELVARGNGYTILAPPAADDRVAARRAGHVSHREPSDVASGLPCPEPAEALDPSVPSGRAHHHRGDRRSCATQNLDDCRTSSAPSSKTHSRGGPSDPGLTVPPWMMADTAQVANWPPLALGLGWLRAWSDASCGGAGNVPASWVH